MLTSSNLKINYQQEEPDAMNLSGTKVGFNYCAKEAIELKLLNRLDVKYN